MNNETDISLKFKNSVTGEAKLERYEKRLKSIKNIISKMPKGTNLQTPITGDYSKQLDTIIDKMGKFKSSADKTNSSLNSMFSLGKIGMFIYAMKKVASVISKTTEKSANYLESLNLYQVAFNGATEEADKFVEKLSDMYGLDEAWLVKTIGLFKQLTNAMQLTEEQGTAVAKLLTQMSIDISSLYNTEQVDRASQVLQSAMASQTRPIRSLTGADITMSTLQTTMGELGINRAVSQLSFAEKRLVIIISLTKQLNKVANDWGKTLESPANQTRILSEQWSRLTRAVGNVFLPIVSKILPYLNGILMALVEIFNTIASLFGFNIEDYDFGAGISDEILDIEEELNKATESSEKLKNSLRGFDKLNNITTSTSTNSGAGLGVSPEIWKAFEQAYEEYMSKIEDVRMKAHDIRDTIIQWGKRLIPVRKIIETIRKITNNVKDNVKAFVKTITDWVNSPQGQRFIENIRTALEIIFEILGYIADLLGEIFRDYILPLLPPVFDIVSAISTILITIFETLKPLFEIIGNILKLDIAFKLTAIKIVLEEISTAIGIISETFSGGIKIIKDIINGDFEQAYEDWKTTWGNIVGIVSPKLEQIKKTVSEKIPEIVEEIKRRWNLATDFFFNFPERLGEWAGKLYLFLKGKIEEVDWAELGTKILKLIFKGLNMLNNIKGIIEDPATAIAKLFRALKDEVDKLELSWVDIGKKILEAIYKGMNPLSSSALKTGKKWGEDFIKGIKKALGINSPSKLVVNAKIGDYTLQGITEGMEKQIPTLKTQAQEIVDTLNSGINQATDVALRYDTNDLAKMSGIDYNKNFISNGILNLENKSMVSMNPTFIIQVGDEEVARHTINKMEEMAKANGKPFTIGG